MTRLKKHSLKKGIFNFSSLAVALLVVLFTAGTALGQKSYAPESGSAAYIADIDELNPKVIEGHIDGLATFIIADGQLYITVMAKGLPPSMMHMQHLHGFTASLKEASCPEEEADANGDGLVDIIETHPYTGRTLIPLNAAPAKIKIKDMSYPVANKNGLFTYRMSVPLDALEASIQKKFGIKEFSPDELAIYIHGIPKGSSLPESVQSVLGAPARLTLPIACGAIESL